MQPVSTDSPVVTRSDIVNFKNPHGTRNKIGRVIWNLTWLLLFRPTPQFMGAWRSFLLKMFGAKIGWARLHPSVRIWAPWRLKLGTHVFVDRDVNLYNAYGITTGDRVVISLGSFLCTASHDYTLTTNPLIGGEIVLGNDVWIAADAFVAPGKKIADGAVVGARAVVVRDVEPWTVVAGNPAKFIRKRELRETPK
jgi:putative colanic acid biosynthesis acetyltransferase WcaF